MLCSYCISCGHGQQDRGSASVCTWAHLVHNSRAWSMCEERMGYRTYCNLVLEVIGLSNWRQGRLACRGEGTTGGDRYLTGVG